ncbi:hypothetical protein LCGC14_3015770 [marine sediment metagenome]|uniref:J domain-containing protein n=1 Tax=marine sediment metagenome TaxID=412755 RepID=A0A0F8Z4E1_9ZZZZ
MPKQLPLSEQAAARLLHAHFGLLSPTTRAAFRHSYRKQAFLVHPDHSQTKDPAPFVALQAAYDLLLQCNAIFAGDTEKQGDTATDGTPLNTLGLGLGSAVNGTDCNKCRTRGYTTAIGKKRVYCEECNDEGVPLKQCPRCRGTCGFTAPDKTHVVCEVCWDKGKILDIIKRKHFSAALPLCKHCHGTKYRTISNRDQPIFHKCLVCNGTGEVRIFNPVIPKGRLAALRQAP